MAKAAKTTKSKKIEEVTPELETPAVPQVEETTTPETEPVVATEEAIEEPIIVEETPEPVVVETPKAQPKEDATMEEKIIAFVDERGGGNYIKLNDFLKSLYPIPKLNEPPAYLQQGASKFLRNTLTNMQAEGKITIKDNTHLRLGTFYYPDDTTMKTHYHNLSTITIEALAKK